MHTPETLRLCPRLAAIAELVPAGRTLVDVGTDHALLPAALVLRGTVPRAVACDQAAEPLARARVMIERHGLADRIALRRGEGFSPLAADEGETAVIAGVGAMTVLRILAAEPARTRGFRRLVLQPNGPFDPNGCGPTAIRRWLVEQGYVIVDERLVEDRGRFYVAIAAEPASVAWASRPSGPEWASRSSGPERSAVEIAAGWSRAAWVFGPVVLRRGGPVLARCLAAELRRCEAALRRTAGRAAMAERRALVAEALAEARALAHPGPA